MNEMISYCKKLIPYLEDVPDEILGRTNEIRVRANMPTVLYGSYGMYITNRSKRISFFEIQELFKKLCEFSVYSRENEIKNGYITVCGGNRVGVCGTAVIKNGEISSIRNISSLNFRIAREYIGCAEKFSNSLFKGGVLVAGPAASGKTTFLRDAARLLSKEGKNVAVVDERGEIAGMNNAVSSFDIGFCDVLSGFPKKDGILYAIRCLSAQYIICDELGQMQEINSVAQCMHAGSFVTASIHLEKIEDIFRRRASFSLLETGAFSTVIFIRNFRAQEYKTEELYEAYGDDYYRFFLRGARSAEGMGAGAESETA